MSRLIPAQPRYETPIEEGLLRYLESSFSDDSLLFQRKPEKNCFLLIDPDRGMCLIIFSDGHHVWNADEETWSGVDHMGLLQKVRFSLPGALARHTIGMVLILPDMPPSNIKYEVRTIYGLGQDIDTPIKEALSLDSRPLKESDMAELVQHFSPGSMPYAKGQIHEIQKKWRAGGPTPEQMLGAEPVRQDIKITLEVAEAMKEDDPLLVLIRQSIINTIEGKKIFAHGVRISLDDLMGAKELLPIVLIVSAEDWTPVVVAKNGVGGFHVHMKTDVDSYTGYTITDIEPSSALLLIMPIMELFKKSVAILDGEEVILLNELIFRFHEFILSRDLSPVNMEMIALRIIGRMDE
jgi:hypothetical protein